MLEIERQALSRNQCWWRAHLVCK